MDLKRKDGQGKVVLRYSGKGSDKKDGSIALSVKDHEKAMKINSGKISVMCEICGKDLSPKNEYVFCVVPSKNYVPKGTPDKNIKLLPAIFLCGNCQENNPSLIGIQKIN